MGIAEPLPAYFYEWQLAHWLGGGTTADDVDEMPLYRVQQARVVMAAMARAQNERKGR